MAFSLQAPYVAQDPSEVAKLIEHLESCTKKNGEAGKVAATSKKTTFQIASPLGHTVDSWQFKEWDYQKSGLPTYARGLFTYETSKKVPEIAVRGYDKFFNVGEVQETRWEHVEAMTRGPYELSVKENGCIIFLAGIEGDHLLVCSKHSTGARQDATLSHATAGDRWVDIHLSKIGKTRADLARELRQRNVTAVAELCDDQFEEHVLAYEPKDAGLYIHGVNLNLPDFATYSGHLVHAFADEWGFKRAQYLVKNDTISMKTFLEQCAETGSFAGRDTEGFVIRCERRGMADIQNNSEYHNWFFKYKFEEPYLMYRQWRECTKAVISGKPPKYKKHKQITEQYLHYARRALAKDPKLGDEYNHNHGIIAMREGFLNERGLKGSDIIRREQEESGHEQPVTGELVLLPVATIGCGKTTVALALSKLFDWGHVQNDNITGKSNRPKQFTQLICNALATRPVCIGDRNNHQMRERKQIIDDISSLIPEARFVAIEYVHDPKPEMLPQIRMITQERIFARGDNHQTIQAGSKSRHEITSIMEGFLKRFEPVDTSHEPDDAFDNIIRLNVSASSRKNLEIVVAYLHEHYPQLVPDMPTSGDLDQAIEAALHDYEPNIKHDLSFKSKKSTNGSQPQQISRQSPAAGGIPVPPKPPKLEYFCVTLPAHEILSTLSTLFSGSLTPTQTNMYQHLQQSRRLQTSFHVTLIHRACVSTHQDAWQHLSSLHASAVTQSAQTSTPTFDPILGTCRVRIERVIWDDRVMCLIARLLDPGWDCVNEIPHVTVGTASSDIKPKESNDMLKRWDEGIGNIMEREVAGYVELVGEVRAVMQR